MSASALSLSNAADEAGFSPNENTLFEAGLLFVRAIKSGLGIQTTPDLLHIENTYPRLYLTTPGDKVEEVAGYLRDQNIAIPGWSGLTLSECVTPYEIGKQAVVVITCCASLAAQYAQILDQKLADATPVPSLASAPVLAVKNG